MKSPYTVPQEVGIQIYLGIMDSLATIFLRRITIGDIDTLEKVFKEEVIFTKNMDPHGRGNFVASLTFDNVVAMSSLLV